MNKKTKGAIAAGAAAALLAGGAGTFALWSDSENLAGGTIQSGKLTLTTAGTPTWTKGGNSIDITTYKVVPGDVITYNATATIGASGNNLAAHLKATVPGLGTSTELAQALQTSTTATVNSVPLPSDPAGVAITSANDGQTVQVQVQFTFDAATANQVAQNQSATFGNVVLDLTQDS
ncbi:alternate-type signal peptide domain-containing protein [Rhodococcus hoagii]|uniref:Alternate-type signal peptide domain-containing protein n=1 Tax=Rhodococcus hoagii TaxID=43767 RepID=A0AAE5CHM8_RHOHA|nr:alternate-type signal peptide domain-containing protein [Prescottella equi]NKS28394.1 alternate-type signal peptide domain-containing protein [Prescottella equi]